MTLRYLKLPGFIKNHFETFIKPVFKENIKALTLY